MLKLFSKLFRTGRTVLTASILVALGLVASGLPAMAQNPPPPTAKKGSASTSCDGALDIVPSKPMTFARKRRPAKTDGKQQLPPTTPADSKSGQKPPGDAKRGN